MTAVRVIGAVRPVIGHQVVIEVNERRYLTSVSGVVEVTGQVWLHCVGTDENLRRFSVTLEVPSA